MPSRNTALLTRIIEVFGDLVSSQEDALARLEQSFADTLLIQAGAVEDVARHAEKLRLAVTEAECALVLDHIGQTGSAKLSIGQTEDAINALFEDRFIEPGP